MGVRQIRLLAALSVLAGLELVIGRIVLPVVRRRWAFPAVPALEAAELAIIGALLFGGLVLATILAWAEMTDEGERPILRTGLFGTLIMLGIVEILSQTWPYLAWLDLIRHPFAALVLVLIVASALLYGISLARAGVGIAAVAMLCATTYRGIALYLPTEGSTRWLAAAAEAASLLVPWVLAVAIARISWEDFIAVLIALGAILLSMAGIWGLAPSVRLVVAQALGFRFAMPPYVHALTVGAFVYFAIRAFRSPVVPREVPWAYFWLTASGIQMAHPYVQFGALAAIAVLAWMPPFHLPARLERGAPKMAEHPVEPEVGR